MSGPVRTSIVVVAYHRPAAIGAFLASIDLDHLEVIVVNVEDDPSVAGCVQTHPKSFRRLKVVPAPTNRGFAAGVNLGVRASTGDLIVVCNDDVVFQPGALQRLLWRVTFIQGVAAPAVVDAEGRRQHTIAAHPSLHRFAVEWALLPDHPPPWPTHALVHKWRLPNRPCRVPGVAAAVIACAKSVLVQFPLPEEYFMYWEEREWFAVLDRAGVPVWYDPASVVVHAGGREDVRSAKTRLLVVNAVRCIRRCEGRWASLASVPIAAVWQLRVLLQELIRVPLGRSDMHRLRARLAGLGALPAALRQAWRSDQCASF